MPDLKSSPGSRLGSTVSGRGNMFLVMTVSLLFTALTMFWSFRAKLACGGEPFFPDGRSARWPVGDPDAVIPCYSDLMFLWIGRDINNHVFPYIHGGINENGHLFGGVVEYPVLSGVLMWLGAIGADTDVDFFVQSAWLLVPFGFATTILLALMTRWWVLLWAATPPMVLYAFHNWELPVVFTAVAGVAVMAFGASLNPKTGRRRLSLRTSAILAAIVLAIGFCLKIYPGLFVLPLAAYVLTGGAAGWRRSLDEDGAARRTLDWAGAVWVAVAAAATVILVQLPFMILGFEGWRAALSFQGKRKADVDTNTMWYWGLRHLTGGQNDTYNSLVGLISPILIMCAFALSMYLGWRAYERTGSFPWIGVSASMLAGFMLFHKVHSPQYTLWILPFFVLLHTRWPVIVLYLISDAVLDLTIFRLFGILSSGADMKWWVIGGVNFGVWVHVVLLAYLIVAFVNAPLREPLRSMTAARRRDDVAVEPTVGVPA